MSILFKGVEMPKGCWDCPFQTNPICATNDILNFTTRIARPDNCPIIGIPHHGRLIDADALLADVRAHSESYFADDFAHEWVDVAPTIIPADKDGEP